MTDRDRTDADAPRDSIDGYYRPPGHLATTTEPIAGPGGHRSRHFALGLILLLAAVPTQFMALCVGAFLLDPESTIEDSDYPGGDPSSVPADAVARVIDASATVRHPQAFFALTLSAVSLLGVIAAVGLMRGKRRGRRLALAWAGAALLYLGTEILVHIVHVFPAYDAVRAHVESRCGTGCLSLLEAVCGLSTAAGPGGFALVELPFFALPIVVLVATMRRSMAQGCSR